MRSTNPKDKRTFDIRRRKRPGVHTACAKEIDACFERMTRQMTADERAEFKRLLLLAADEAITSGD